MDDDFEVDTKVLFTISTGEVLTGKIVETIEPSTRYKHSTYEILTQDDRTFIISGVNIWAEED